jgi:hypothetical protein
MAWLDEIDALITGDAGPPPDAAEVEAFVEYGVEATDEAVDATPVAPGQEGLFGDSDQFHTTWQQWEGMPEFVQEDLKPESELTVKFRCEADRIAFGELIGQPIRQLELRGVWYPKIEIGSYWNVRYRDPVDDGKDAAVRALGHEA